ncbi:hypothetical protein [Streptomyces orinoci]|uniref:Metallo-beta-lactamase domain-containing protein n=1 Tax=Streptomyces orinoci TaxID=67339 RepID=A0ABV3JZ62_STRON|nr:hypothetical protein [Streptomyces orinoci]
MGAKLAQYLGRMKNPNVLDCLVLTHPDRDHYNLLPKVLLNDKNKLRYTIKQVRFSGELGHYRNDLDGGVSIADILENWRSYSSAPPPWRSGAPVTEPSPTAPRLLLSGPGTNPAELYVLAANTAASRGRPRKRKAPFAAARSHRWPLPVERLDSPHTAMAGTRHRRAAEYNSNRGSIVLMLAGRNPSGARQRVFLTADAGRDVEKSILENLGDAAPGLRRTGNTWLKMGHHGSTTSTSDEWLARLTPDGLLISAGTKTFGRHGTGMPSFSHLEHVLEQRKGFKPPLPAPAKPRSAPKVAYFADEDGDLPRRVDERFRTEKAIAGLATNMCQLPPDDERETGFAKGVDWHLTIDADGPNTYKLGYK